MQAAAIVLSARLNPQSETQWAQQNESAKGTLQKSKKNSSGFENDRTRLKDLNSQTVADIRYFHMTVLFHPIPIYEYAVCP